MAIRPFLAMTAAEIRKNPADSRRICWMACHFSPYGLGLSNLPGTLPPGSLLMVDDITPIHGHRPDLIATQLEDTVTRLDCAGVLLDFQRPGSRETEVLAEYLTGALPCPVAVSDVYAAELACPVFLSAPVCQVPLEDQLRPWQGREVWLELAKNAEMITLTNQGARMQPLPCWDSGLEGFKEDTLHCHYRAEVGEDSAVFTLWRTEEDLKDLLLQAESLGVTAAIGLFQELGAFP